MADLAIVGNSEFTLGFSLIGIKKIYEGETASELKTAYTKAIKDPSVGIIVTDLDSKNKVDAPTKRMIDQTITPVIVTISTDPGGADNLREMVKKAIGIDIMAR